jgi:hypothetical protein
VLPVITSSPASFTVNARTGAPDFRWGAGDWSHARGSAPATPPGNEPSNTSGNGWLCPSASCTQLLGNALAWIQPDVEANQGCELSPTPINGGPNHGLYYVLRSSFVYRTASSIRIGFGQNWTTAYVTPFDQLEACRALLNNAGIGPNINWWNYNQRCTGLDPNYIIQTILNHEEGHHQQGVAAASTNDPRAAIEGLVGPDETLLRQAIQQEVRVANEAMEMAIMPQPSTARIGVWFFVFGAWRVYEWPL